MSLMARELREVWDALRTSNGHREDALSAVRIRGLRGIRALEEKLQAVAEQQGRAVQLLFLPGAGPPEQWLWERVRKRPEEYAARLGMAAADMQKTMNDLERLFAGRVQQHDAARVSINALAYRPERTVPDVARIIGRREAEKNTIGELLAGLKTLIERWRRL